MAPPRRPPLDRATTLLLAGKAYVDPKTIQKVYDGVPVKGMAGRRATIAIEAWLREESEHGTRGFRL